MSEDNHVKFTKPEKVVISLTIPFTRYIYRRTGRSHSEVLFKDLNLKRFNIHTYTHTHMYIHILNYIFSNTGLI